MVGSWPSAMSHIVIALGLLGPLWKGRNRCKFARSRSGRLRGNIDDDQERNRENGVGERDQLVVTLDLEIGIFETDIFCNSHGIISSGNDDLWRGLFGKPT